MRFAESDLPPLRLFGMVSAMTLMAALLADLIFLPATIVLWRRFKMRRDAASG